MTLGQKQRAFTRMFNLELGKTFTGSSNIRTSTIYTEMKKEPKGSFVVSVTLRIQLQS